MINDFPEWYFTSETGDFPLYLFLSQHGKFKYLSFVGSVYRRHSGGVTFAHKVDARSKLKILLKRIESFRNYDNFLERKHSDTIQKRIVEMYNEVVDISYLLDKGKVVKDLSKSGHLTIWNIKGIKRKIKYFFTLFLS